MQPLTIAYIFSFPNTECHMRITKEAPALKIAYDFNSFPTLSVKKEFIQVPSLHDKTSVGGGNFTDVEGAAKPVAVARA